MELLQLKYFCHAAETQNFSRTARAFLVPHSNISQCIKKLETELGTPLFDRSGNRVVLNAKGQAFYREIRSALDTIENATTAAQSRKDATIRVGIHLGIRAVMKTIAQFQRSHPDMNVISKRLLSNSAPGEFDVIIADGYFSAPDFFDMATYLTDSLCLVAAKGVLPDDPFSAEFLREQSFITIPPGSSMYASLHRVCESFGFTPRISLQCEESLFVLQHVEAGLGLAIIPRRTVLRHVGDRVDIRPIEGFTRSTCLYRSKKFPSPRLLDEFEALLKVELDRLTLH